MAKTVASFTMSLDGFIADAHDDIMPLFKWYFSGDHAFPMPGTNRSFKVSSASVEIMEELFGGFGAIVTGRRDFDVSKAWGGKSPLDVPIFIVTHHPPQEWLNRESPFTFVTEGVASAIEHAQKVAGDKMIAVGGSQITRQAIQLGLLDEIHIQLAHFLLGDGISLFGHLGVNPIELERLRVIDAPDVTHLKFRIVK